MYRFCNWENKWFELGIFKVLMHYVQIWKTLPLISLEGRKGKQKDASTQPGSRAALAGWIHQSSSRCQTSPTPVSQPQSSEFLFNDPLSVLVVSDAVGSLVEISTSVRSAPLWSHVSLQLMRLVHPPLSQGLLCLFLPVSPPDHLPLVWIASQADA